MASVPPPFQTAYWADARGLVDTIKSGAPVSCLENRELQRVLLDHLSAAMPNGWFEPRNVEFAETAVQIRSRTEFRERHFALVFTGQTTAPSLAAACELVISRTGKGAQIQIKFKGFDVFEEWENTKACIAQAFEIAKRCGWKLRIQVTSACRKLPSDFFDFCYAFPATRLRWIGSPFVECKREEVPTLLAESEAFRTLVEFSEMGGWPHIVLPVSATNVHALPALVAALIDNTRGASVEVTPAAFLSSEGNAPANSLDTSAFVNSVLEISRNLRIPVALVSPLAWVAERCQADWPRISSHFAAGSEIAIDENGQAYAGDCVAGMPGWTLGNVFDDPKEIRWEQVDAIPELFGNRSKPDKCRSCDWRYRCGGIDSSIQAMQRIGLSHGLTGDPLFDLYCEPRKALFESLIWAVAETCEVSQPRRELISLSREAVHFQPAPDAQKAQTKE